MSEYIIIVALIAIGTIAFVGFFGDNLRHLFGDSAAALSGVDNVANSGSRSAPNPEKDLYNFGVHKSAGKHMKGANHHNGG